MMALVEHGETGESVRVPIAVPDELRAVAARLCQSDPILARQFVLAFAFRQRVAAEFERRLAKRERIAGNSLENSVQPGRTDLVIRPYLPSNMYAALEEGAPPKTHVYPPEIPTAAFPPK